jgi:Domain of unknown function (DUF4082)/PEP-CTERM motif
MYRGNMGRLGHLGGEDLAMVRILCAALLLTVGQPAYADTIGVSFAGGFKTLTEFDTVIGWQFTANTDLHAGALGMWDEGGDGFAEVVDVGLWTDDGTLLSSVTVGTGAPLEGGFRFAPISPVLLSGGESYVVAGLLREPDYYRAFGTVTNSPLVTWTDGRGHNTDVLTFPTETTGRAGSYFGANLRVTQAQPVPEPASLALVAFGIAGVCGWRWRNRGRRSDVVASAAPRRRS